MSRTNIFVQKLSLLCDALLFLFEYISKKKNFFFSSANIRFHFQLYSYTQAPEKKPHWLLCEMILFNVAQWRNSSPDKNMMKKKKKAKQNKNLKQKKKRKEWENGCRSHVIKILAMPTRIRHSTYQSESYINIEVCTHILYFPKANPDSELVWKQKKRRKKKNQKKKRESVQLKTIELEIHRLCHLEVTEYLANQIAYLTNLKWNVKKNIYAI